MKRRRLDKEVRFRASKIDRERIDRLMEIHETDSLSALMRLLIAQEINRHNEGI
jgi:hypothetical protein